MTFHSESIDRLYQAISSLETKEECRIFFEDLCTIKELQDMAQRFDTAVLLSEGLSYQKIQQQVEVSTATIGRVSKCLNYGSGGYQHIIEKCKQKETDS